MSGAVFGALSAFCADRVRLRNGDVLTGKLTRMEGGVLHLKTDYSKPVEIKVDKIRYISTDEAVEVHLTDGQIIKGKLSGDEEGNLVVASEIGCGCLGELGQGGGYQPAPGEMAGQRSRGGNR